MKNLWLLLNKRVFKLTELLLYVIKPSYFFLGILFYLLVSWAIWYLIDIRNWLGLRDLIIIRDYYGILAGEIVPLWWFIFREAGPTEFLQWIALALTSLGSAVLAYRLHEINLKNLAIFWRLMSVVTLLMLIEDAINIRHVISYLFVYLAGLEWSSSTGFYLRTFMEISYFIVLAILPLYTIIKYGRFIWGFAHVRNFILSGYFFYGMAVAASGTRFISEWYITVGSYLYEFMIIHAKGNIIYASGENLPMGFWLMDFMVEESLELVGAASLLTATISFYHWMGRGSINN